MRSRETAVTLLRQPCRPLKRMRPFNSLKDAEIWMDQNASVGMRGMSVYLTLDATTVRCSLHWTIPGRVGGFYDESSAMIFRLRGELTGY